MCGRGLLGKWGPNPACDPIITRVHGSTLQVMRNIMAKEGWLALFSGWTAAVARAFPANAGLFAGVELASRLMGTS